MKTTLTFTHSEIEYLQAAIEYAIEYSKEGVEQAYDSMERRDVDGHLIDIQNFKALGIRLGMKFE